MAKAYQKTTLCFCLQCIPRSSRTDCATVEVWKILLLLLKIAHVNECLIEVVCRYLCLYNISNVNYEVKANAWRNVGAKVGLSGRTLLKQWSWWNSETCFEIWDWNTSCCVLADEAQTKWKSLRDKFRRPKNAKETLFRSGTASCSQPEWGMDETCGL